MKTLFLLVFCVFWFQSSTLTLSANAQTGHETQAATNQDPGGSSPLANFFQKIGSWFKKTFTSPSTANSPRAIPLAIPVNEKQVGYYGSYAHLGAASTQFPTPPGRIEVRLPKDRCKSGVIRFGSLECSVLGRGQTEEFPIAGYIQGTHNNGQACFFKPASKRKGATPTGQYRISGVRPMGTDKKHWGRDGWSLEPIRLAPPLIDDRAGFVLHSDQNTGANLDYRETWGCLKVDQACQEALDRHIWDLKNSGKGIIINVQEDE